MVIDLSMLGIRFFRHKDGCIHPFHKARVGLDIVVAYTTRAASIMRGRAVVVPGLLVSARLWVGVRRSGSVAHRRHRSRTRVGVGRKIVVAFGWRSAGG